MLVKTLLTFLIISFSQVKQESSFLGIYSWQTQDGAHSLAEFTIWINEDYSYKFEAIDDKCSSININSGTWNFKGGVLTLISKKSAFYDYTISGNGKITIDKGEIELDPCHSTTSFTQLNLFYLNGNLCNQASGEMGCYTKIASKKK